MQESLNELISREWSTAQLSSELQKILGQKLGLNLDRWWRKPAREGWEEGNWATGNSSSRWDGLASGKPNNSLFGITKLHASPFLSFLWKREKKSRTKKQKLGGLDSQLGELLNQIILSHPIPFLTSDSHIKKKSLAPRRQERHLRWRKSQ